MPIILEVHEPPDYEPRLVANNPDLRMIENVVKELAWAEITYVVLKIDDRNWIEGSGSVSPNDGLSARYMQGGREFVSLRPPTSLDQIVVILDSFCAQDNRWKTLVEWE